MIYVFQILLFVIMILSGILAAGSDEMGERSMKVFAASLAAMLVTLFVLEGGFF